MRLLACEGFGLFGQLGTDSMVQHLPSTAPESHCIISRHKLEDTEILGSQFEHSQSYAPRPHTNYYATAEYTHKLPTSCIISSLASRKAKIQNQCLVLSLILNTSLK